MPRNASGIYTLPVGAFSPGLLIKSSDMNANYSDIATALTGSLPVNGSTGMTGPFLAADGIMSAPGIAFASDKQTGFYRTGLGQFSWVSNGVVQGAFGTSGLNLSGALAVLGNTTLNNLSLLGTLNTVNATFTGAVTVSGTIGSNVAGQSVALASPLSATYGGTPLFVQSGASSGAANAQTYATYSSVPNNYAYGSGQLLSINPGATNTSAMTLAANGQAARNVYKQVAGSLVALSGGEVQAGNYALMADDGTQLELLNPGIPTPQSYGTNSAISKSQHGAIIDISAAITLTIPSPYNGGLFFLNVAANIAPTITASSGNIGGPGGSGSGSATIPARTAGSFNILVSDGSAWYLGALTKAGYQAPSVQKLTSVGSGTYTPATGCTISRVKFAGAGGGGGGSAANSAGSTGGTTTFGSWTALGGSASPGAAPSTFYARNGAGGTGGAAGSTGTLILRQQGGYGLDNNTDYYPIVGGSSVFGPGLGFTSGASIPQTTLGAGGLGQGGAGGGGEGIELWLPSPAATTIFIGTGGAGGSTGTYSGGAGASGAIYVEEFFF